jgi:hypothetical protein
VVDAVDKLLRRYPDSPIVEDVLGTLDAGEIRARVAELDPTCEEIFYFAASVGALFGLRRRDGSRVAMKIHKLFTDEAYFDEVQNLQSALAAAGWPAPKPLGRRGLVTWEEWRDAGEFRNAHEPDVRRAMARALARFHQLATATRFRPRRTFLRSGADGLWPVPHNALFDFEATKQGAEWIDEIARAAKVRSRDTEVGVELVGRTGARSTSASTSGSSRPCSTTGTASPPTSSRCSSERPRQLHLYRGTRTSNRCMARR